MGRLEPADASGPPGPGCRRPAFQQQIDDRGLPPRDRASPPKAVIASAHLPVGVGERPDQGGDRALVADVTQRPGRGDAALSRSVSASNSISIGAPALPARLGRALRGGGPDPRIGIPQQPGELLVGADRADQPKRARRRRPHQRFAVGGAGLNHARQFAAAEVAQQAGGGRRGPARRRRPGPPARRGRPPARRGRAAPRAASGPDRGIADPPAPARSARWPRSLPVRMPDGADHRRCRTRDAEWCRCSASSSRAPGHPELDQQRLGVGRVLRPLDRSPPAGPGRPRRSSATAARMRISGSGSSSATDQRRLGGSGRSAPAPRRSACGPTRRDRPAPAPAGRSPRCRRTAPARRRCGPGRRARDR